MCNQRYCLQCPPINRRNEHTGILLRRTVIFPTQNWNIPDFPRSDFDTLDVLSAIKGSSTVNSPNTITLPQPAQKRDIHYMIRMTREERAALNALARQSKVSTAEMVRHLLFQAVALCAEQREAALEA